VTHSVIGYKLLQKRDKEITVAFLWLSIILILIATALFYQVLKIASLS
jgi:accessory gene regulator protein AgrB